MKSLTPLLFCLLLACSSSGSQETSSQDSTAVADTAVVDVAETEGQEQEMDSGEEYEDGEGNSEGYGDGEGEGQNALDVEYDKWTSDVESLSADLLRITISTSAYEASADVTWLFNDTMEPLYFKQEYALEGSEGSTEYYIDGGGMVACAYITEGIIISKWCMDTNGREEMEGEVKELGEEFGQEQNEALKRYRDELNALLKLELVSDEDGEVTLRSEETETYGEVESKTITEVKLPKKLYEALVK